MSAFDPLVLAKPAASPVLAPTPPMGSHGPLWERSRMEWHLGDPGDPAQLLEDFLAAHGFAVRDLARARPPTPPAAAALLLSAAAGAAIVGAPTGPASPCPAVPDLL